MQQADIENAKMTSSAGPQGVIKHIIVLTTIVWLSVSEAHSALSFNPSAQGSCAFSNIRVSCIYLSLAVRFNHVLIIGSFKDNQGFFVQQYSLTVQNGTVPRLPLSGCVLPDRGRARWREVG